MAETRRSFARDDEECVECAYPFDAGQWCLAIGDDFVFCSLKCAQRWIARRDAAAAVISRMEGR